MGMSTAGETPIPRGSLYIPQDSEVELHGRSIDQQTPSQAGLADLFQKTSSLDTRSVCFGSVSSLHQAPVQNITLSAVDSSRYPRWQVWARLNVTLVLSWMQPVLMMATAAAGQQEPMFRRSHHEINVCRSGIGDRSSLASTKSFSPSPKTYSLLTT